LASTFTAPSIAVRQPCLCFTPSILPCNRKWDASADYMFFRENVPNEAKLRAKMEIAPGKPRICVFVRHTARGKRY